ncbi:WD repeat-containing protein 76 [Ricinus communis]|uniref:WD repeat-containing protein 76 n=1 Tax=Ricinus communis TaxID=3988 RepID=UPI00201AEBC8|nr:WD repeat-containing protein 76 [Ricinus communis]
MAPQKLTEYEKKRLENIRRNDEMMAALKIHAAASQLSAAAAKRQRIGSSKSYKASPEKKKPKNDSPIVIRQSLRIRGMPPDSIGLDHDFSGMPSVNAATTSAVQKPSPRVMGPLSMTDAYSGTGSFRALIDTVVSLETKPQVGLSVKKGLGVSIESKTHVGVSVKKEVDGYEAVKVERSDGIFNGPVKSVVEYEYLDSGVKIEKKEVEGCVDLWSMNLKQENVARVLPGRIMVVKFLPCNDVRMIVAGNKFGNVAFWNVDSEGEDGDGIYLFRQHTGPISGILFQQSCLSKIFTSCYDGYLRLMNAEKEVFDLVYSSDDTIFSLSQQPNDTNGLYFGEGRGGLSVWDERTGRLSFQWDLHEDRINSIDFNSQNPNIMATSSTDGTACLWDIRSVSPAKPKSLKIVSHNRAVHSAYFSPSGSYLATTSPDNTVGVLSTADFEDTCRIDHYNQTGRWISSFRAIWGWDDSYIFIGNMKRGVDIISRPQRRAILTLQSPHMSAIPCRFDAHPYNVGMLAGATSGGQVYIWTSS